MKLTLTITAILLAGCSQPWHADGIHTGPGAIIEAEATYPWTARSKWLCGAMVGAHYLDYETSRRLNFGEPAGTGGHFNETNPFLSEHPSDSEVALFKGGVVLGTVLLAEIFPKHRDVIFLTSGMCAGLAAANNERLLHKHK